MGFLYKGSEYERTDDKGILSNEEDERCTCEYENWDGGIYSWMQHVKHEHD